VGTGRGERQTVKSATGIIVLTVVQHLQELGMNKMLPAIQKSVPYLEN
jgi:hypothetical protein